METLCCGDAEMAAAKGQPEIENKEIEIYTCQPPDTKVFKTAATQGLKELEYVFTCKVQSGINLIVGLTSVLTLLALTGI